MLLVLEVVASCLCLRLPSRNGECFEVGIDDKREMELIPNILELDF